MEKLVDLLAELAEQLGVTIEYLWPKAVFYVWSQALVEIVVTWSLVLIVGIIFYRNRNDNWFIPPKSHYDFGAPTMKFFSGIAFLFITLTANVSTCVNAPTILAPEGKLVRDVLRR